MAKQKPKQKGGAFFSFVIILSLAFCCAELFNFIESNLSRQPVPSFDKIAFTSNHISTLVTAGYVGQFGSHSIPPIVPTNINLVGVDQEVKPVSQGESPKPPAVYLKYKRQGVTRISHEKYKNNQGALQGNSTTPNWQAELVSKSYESINIAANRKITYEVEFKNTGSVTWSNGGQHYVALNVSGPTGRHSDFQDTTWKEYYYRPCRMSQSEVRPGDIAKFRFVLAVPNNANNYVEKFTLVAENLTFIPGSEFEIPIQVGDPKPHWKAQLVSKKYNSINIVPDKKITYEVEFKNVGSATWYNSGDHFVALNVANPIGRTSAFKDDSWNEYSYRPGRLLQSEVAPNEVGTFRFVLSAPSTQNSYTEHFALVAENLTFIPGGEFDVPIAVERESTPFTKSEGEPIMRVGLYSTEDSVQITANGAFEIRDAGDVLLSSYNSSETATITPQRENGSPIFSVNTQGFSNSFVRLIANSEETIFEITNYENRPAWNSELNDNKFRGNLEIRYSEETDKFWVINELPLEAYTRGIAEAGNDNDEDYLKALMIAARTYAQYHYDTNTKHDEEYYHVDSTYDQVYRGYNFELRSPNITQAIENTKGTMVTYEDELVVTPYFSNTDGRTRSWEEVWSGGPYAWLVSVPDPHCEGMELYGHGVGMSAYGARAMAEEGSTYEQILKHYYTGVEVEAIY